MTIRRPNETEEEYRRRCRRDEEDERQEQQRRDDDRRRREWDNSVLNPTSPISIAIDVATPGGMF